MYRRGWRRGWDNSTYICGLVDRAVRLWTQERFRKTYAHIINDQVTYYPMQPARYAVSARLDFASGPLQMNRLFVAAICP
jgi:hypothetical protein